MGSTMNLSRSVGSSSKKTSMLNVLHFRIMQSAYKV